MKAKWDYQEGWSSGRILLDELDFWVWRHCHWLWWGKESALQWFRDKEKK